MFNHVHLSSVDKLTRAVCAEHVDEAAVCKAAPACSQHCPAFRMLRRNIMQHVGVFNHSWNYIVRHVHSVILEALKHLGKGKRQICIVTLLVCRMATLGCC